MQNAFIDFDNFFCENEKTLGEKNYIRLSGSFTSIPLILIHRHEMQTISGNLLTSSCYYMLFYEHTCK